MKFIYALFLFANTALAALPSAVPSVTVSAPGANTGQVSISPSQLSGTGVNGIFSLYGYSGSPSANYFYVLYKNGSPYTTGSSTKAYCFDVTISENSTGDHMQLVSSQASITNNSSTALTNGVYQGGATQIYPLATGVAANTITIAPGVYVFGDGSHATSAGFQISAGAWNVHMDCYEQ